MQSLRNFLVMAILVSGLAGAAVHAQQLTVGQAIDRIIQRENEEVRMLRQYDPIVETYVQDMRADQVSGLLPTTDHYFLGKAILSQGLVEEPSSGKKSKKREDVRLGGLSGVFPKESESDGFLQLIYIDPNGFDRQHYRLDYVRREFLGEVRCLVFDVAPLEGAGNDRFQGRIWVEDQNYTIIRFNGGNFPAEHPKGFRLHFDSWRVSATPSVWVPAYIYSAESEVHDLLGNKVRFRAQTRLWGYNSKHVRDENRSVAESERVRGREAEESVVDRLEAAGLLAPIGAVDKILYTVVNNLEVSNNLDIEPDIECRVLLTSTLESFAIGHTLVISRGLLDVLADESSLAMILAHELGHILVAPTLRDQWAFSDWSIFPSEKGFTHFGFPIDPHIEDLANGKASELLGKSPYRDKMGSAILLLQSLDSQAKSLPNLISPHVAGLAPLGSRLLTMAPHNAANKGEQIAVLPLGSRIDLDPWTDQVEIMKTKPVALGSSRQRQPFEIGHYVPELLRHDAMKTKQP